MSFIFFSFFCLFTTIKSTINEPPPCMNLHKKCTQWSLINECELNPEYMSIYCAKACNTCNEQPISLRNEYCFNSHKPESDCYEWAQNNECTKNFNYMFKYCSKACNYCTYEDRCQPNKQFKSVMNLTQSSTSNFHNRLFYDKILSNKFLVNKYEISLINIFPPILKFNNFLPSIIVDQFLNQKFNFQRSTGSGDIDNQGLYQRSIIKERTSLNTWCDYNSPCFIHNATQLIYSNLEEILGISRDFYEQFQILNYSRNQYYQYHHDFIQVQKDLICGPRILTFFMYLSDVDNGGETSFPELGIDIKPKKGMAILWPNIDNHDPYNPEPKTGHIAKSVNKGIKYAANVWIHLLEYKNAFLKLCTG